jgi:1-acyl-sn-glycerol-3-phosphate acyltransferase
MRRISALVYGLCNFLLRIVLRVVARWEVEGREHVPAEGPAILVCNHIHLVDPPLIGAASPRRLHPMAKRELFEVPLIGWFFWAYGAFPVRRFSADLGALRVAQGRLRQGELVLMFPEGTRSKDSALQPALPGAAMVALMSRVPIIPVAITGSRIKFKFVFIQWIVGRRPNIRVVFGKPFELSEFRAEIASAEQATDHMMRQIAALLPQEMRGAYGDETAGRVVVRRQGRNGGNGRASLPEPPESLESEDSPSASSGGG